jgi:hypothetical protein
MLLNRGFHMDLFIVYLGTDIPDYQELYTVVEKLLKQLVSRIPVSEISLPDNKV